MHGEEGGKRAVWPSIYREEGVRAAPNRQFKQTTTATATRATPNKRIDEQNNSCERAF